MKRTVYIPVEVKARGLNAKMLLAEALLRNGFKVIIGAHGNVRDLALQDKNGIYIEKDLFYLRSESLKKLKDNGFLLYAYDEEGLVYLQKKLYIDMRTHEDTIELLDKVFTWGNEEHELLEKSYPQFKTKFLKVGNPRIDIIKNGYVDKIYSEEIQKIKKFSPFILINSNFTSADDPVKAAKHNIEITVQHGKEDRSSQYYDLIKDYFILTQKTYDSFIDAIEFISNNTDINVIVRTHPAEDTSKWKKVESLKNVSIITKYDANPWIYCSDGVIHHSCTTGVEAVLMGKPVISFDPISTELSIEHFPDDVSINAINNQDLLDKVQRYILDKEKTEYPSSIIEEHIYFEDGHGIAIDRMVSQILLDASNNPVDESKSFDESLFWNLIDPIMLTSEKILQILRSKSRKFSYETKHMFIKRLSRMKKNEESINVKHIGNNLFLLESNRV